MEKINKLQGINKINCAEYNQYYAIEIYKKNDQIVIKIEFRLVFSLSLSLACACVFFHMVLMNYYSCPVDDKLISRFRGSWSDTGVYETQVYAYMKTFRFTGSPALYIECDVRMCHGRCPVSSSPVQCEFCFDNC